VSEEVCGKKCEVYSRVVGYYRPVQNWNKGKREEFKERLEYSEPDCSGFEETVQEQ
jgi:anaerobic ribonucleoside-triphosphate reductase